MSYQRQEGLVFFTDLSGFGRLTKGMEMEETAELLTGFARIVARIVPDAGGTVVDLISDSALGWFPPEAADRGVRALMALKAESEAWLAERKTPMKLKVAAHYGEFLEIVLPPFDSPDLLGETVNIAVRLGEGGVSTNRDRLILSAAAFRKLEPATRKIFHKHTEPVVYLAEK